MLGGLSVLAALSSTPDPIQILSMVGTVVFSVGVAFATLKANQRHTDDQIENVRQDLKDIKDRCEELSHDNHQLRLELARVQARTDAQERVTSEVSQALKEVSANLVATREAVIELKGLLSARPNPGNSRAGVNSRSGGNS